MSQDLVPSTVELGVLRAGDAQDLIAQATSIATLLSRLIEERQMYVTLRGRPFVRCEGWTTLAALLGVTPHEVATTEQEGIYTSVVELRRLSDGTVVARASAECGAADEVDGDGQPTWASRPRYARRSMALTRATAKACRLAFSWIMVLAGYEPTPAEEMVAAEPERTSAEPRESRRVLPNRIPFGKHKGKALSECSHDYLVSVRDWCLERQGFEDLIEAINQELERRREAEEPATSGASA
jgi:hypothetical protein